MFKHPVYYMVYSAAFHHLRARFVACVTSIQSEHSKYLSSMVGLWQLLLVGPESRGVFVQRSRPRAAQALHPTAAATPTSATPSRTANILACR